MQDLAEAAVAQQQSRLDDRARALGESPDLLDRAQAAIDRSREALRRSADRISRSQADLDRTHSSKARDRAAVDRDQWPVGRGYLSTESMKKLFESSNEEVVQALLELQSGRFWVLGANFALQAAHR